MLITGVAVGIIVCITASDTESVFRRLDQGDKFRISSTMERPALGVYLTTTIIRALCPHHGINSSDLLTAVCYFQVCWQNIAWGHGMPISNKFALAIDFTTSFMASDVFDSIASQHGAKVNCPYLRRRCAGFCEGPACHFVCNREVHMLSRSSSCDKERGGPKKAHWHFDARVSVERMSDVRIQRE